MNTPPRSLRLETLDLRLFLAADLGFCQTELVTDSDFINAPAALHANEFSSVANANLPDGPVISLSSQAIQNVSKMLEQAEEQLTNLDDRLEQLKHIADRTMDLKNEAMENLEQLDQEQESILNRIKELESQTRYNGGVVYLNDDGEVLAGTSKGTTKVAQVSQCGEQWKTISSDGTVEFFDTQEQAEQSAFEDGKKELLRQQQQSNAAESEIDELNDRSTEIHREKQIQDANRNSALENALNESSPNNAGSDDVDFKNTDELNETIRNLEEERQRIVKRISELRHDQETVRNEVLDAEAERLEQLRKEANRKPAQPSGDSNPNAAQPDQKSNDNIKITSGKNDSKSLFTQTIDQYFRSPDSKHQVIQDLGPLPAVPLGCHTTRQNFPNNGTATGIKPGQRIVVGSGGSETCVIFVAVNRAVGKVWVFHFSENDDPNETLPKYPFPSGTRGALGGGNNEPGSNQLIDDILDQLGSDVKIEGFLDRWGLFYDWENDNWVYDPEVDKPSNNVEK